MVKTIGGIPRELDVLFLIFPDWHMRRSVIMHKSAHEW